MALSQVEMSRLREEEEFRALVRADIESKKPKPKTLLGRMIKGVENSRLGIWAITGFIAGIASVLLTEAVASWKRSSEKSAHMREVAVEIDRRLAIFANQIAVRVDPEKNYAVRPSGGSNYPGELKALIERVFAAKKGSYIYSTQKWADWTISQLISELSFLAPHDDELDGAVRSIQQYSLVVDVQAGALNTNFSHPIEWFKGICKEWMPYARYLGGRSRIPLIDPHANRDTSEVKKQICWNIK